MTKTVPLGNDRRAAIADAAIRLVATRGLRGLTHRAVDAEAGLPPGSTSYYLRTRDALLTACVNRMLDHDAAAVGQMPPTADP
ncbi:MAG TPA: TetR family transcriptional regulator, partial [Kribbella sp.]